MFNINKYKYCEIVCNFLNNTKGCIEDYEIRFMLLNIFNLDISEKEYKKYITFDLQHKLNNDVELDNGNCFYEDLHTLYAKIKQNIKNT